MTLDSRDSDVARSLIPAAVGGDVTRSRLLARLTAAMDEPWTLTLVSAPAGAGKTRLLTQWAHAISADPDTEIVWLSLQRWDDDLSLLRLALERIDDSRLRAGLARVPEVWSTDTARSLARALRATDRRIVVIIDDVHFIETTRLADMLSAFVHAVSGNAHVVLSGRGTRMIPLARRRIAGVALELENRDLAFTPAEVRSYFRARGVSLSQGEITTVLQRTAGWATGLRLLELAALHDPFVADLPLHGDSPLVVDYFAEEVFVDLDDELSEFLVLTSVPEWFTAELAYRLSRGAPATTVIERLMRLNVLISRSGDEPARYQYHPLLREFLNARLADRGAALRESLEKSAAEWFAQEHEYLLALTHATRSRDGVCISLILRRCGMQLILMGHADEVIAATGQIPSPLLEDPSVQMLIAAAELALGDAAPAAAVLTSPQAEESLVFRRWQAGLDLHTAVRRGGIAEALGRRDPGLDVVTGESQLDTYAFLQAAMGELYIGRLDRAEQYARFAGDHARATEAAAAELQAAAILNTSALFRGRMHDVLESGAALDERWHALGEPVNSFYEVTRVWRHWVPYEHMHAIDADRALRAISAVIDSSPELAIARGLRAMIALLTAESAVDPRVAAVALLENLLPRDDMPLPVHWYAMIGSFAVHAFDRLDEPVLRDHFIAGADPLLDGTGEARILRAIAARHDECGDGVRELLAPVLSGVTACLLPASMVDAWLLAAGMDARDGRVDEAQSALAAALSFAEPEEHIRRFAMAGPAVARLLAARATAASRSRFADRVRERLADAGMLVDDDALTHRERIVLAALSHNATLREIAQQEYISPNTVKTHVRNIYRKLGVSDREGVTAAAHALGIE